MHYQDARRGMEVRARTSRHGILAANNHRKFVPAGAMGHIVRVGTEKMLVRFLYGVLSKYSGPQAVWVLASDLDPTVGGTESSEAIAMAKEMEHEEETTRRLGTPPAHGDHISSDDPRIQWLLEDMGTAMRNLGAVDDYDKMLVELHLPVRVAEWEVELELGNVLFYGRVKASTEEQAQYRFETTIAADMKAAMLGVDDKDVERYPIRDMKVLS